MQKFKFILYVMITSTVLNIFIIYLRPWWIQSFMISSFNDQCDYRRCTAINRARHSNISNNIYIRRIKKAGNREKLTFKVAVCRNYIEILISNVRLINDTRKALHIFVFNQATGSFMAHYHQRIDVSIQSIQQDTLSFLNTIQDGRILIFVYQNLSIKQTNTSFRLADLRFQLYQYASSSMTNQYRQDHIHSWIMIGFCGVGKLTEIIQPTSQVKRNQCLTLTKSIQLSEEMVVCPNWPNTQRTLAKRRLCQLMEGFRSVCSCDKGYEIPKFPNYKMTSSILIPIAIISNHDPHYLFRTLSRLTSVQFIHHQYILVFKDHSYEESKLIADVFNIQIVKVKTFNNINPSDQLSYKYRTAVATAFRYFKNSQEIIFMEDTTDVSVDFLYYFNQTKVYLSQPDNLFCVAAHSNQRNCQISLLNDTYLGEKFPYGSFMLSRNVWAEQLSVYWPDHLSISHWREWIGSLMNKLGRACLYPFINRERTFGSTTISDEQTVLNGVYYNYTINMNPPPHKYDSWLKQVSKSTTLYFTRNIDQINCSNRMKLQLSIPKNVTLAIIRVPTVSSQDTRRWHKLKKCMTLSMEEFKSCWYKNTCFVCYENKKVLFIKTSV